VRPECSSHCHYECSSSLSLFQAVRFYDCTHNLMRLQIDHKASVLDVCFDDDDRRCFSVGLEQAVSCTDLSTGARSSLGPGHTATVRCVVWHSGTQTAFTGGWDGKLCAWDTRQAKAAQSTTPQEGNKVSR
jgi:WD40 repeat protein